MRSCTEWKKIEPWSSMTIQTSLVLAPASVTFTVSKSEKQIVKLKTGLAQKKSRRRNHQSKTKRKKFTLKIDPKDAKTRQHSLCMTERRISRPGGKAPLIDTNVPGLPMEEPVAAPGWFRMERLREYISGNRYRMDFGCCDRCDSLLSKI